MSLASPTYLWLVLLAPAAAAAAAWLWRRRLDADAAWASRGLWDRLLPAYSSRRLAVSVVTLSLAVLGVSLALARPRWGQGEQKVERKGVDVVFLIDSSLSMGALDVSPSRLFVAKSMVRRMAQALPGNRVGLVQAEGDAVMLAPLTLDAAVLDLLLDTIDAGSLPTPGTELAPGIETALRLFGEGTEKHRVLVMLSDGEDHGGGLDAEIARLKEEGVAVFALGVGTPQGAPVPIPGSAGEFKREEDGGVVMSRLHEEELEKLARSTGGTYLRVTSAAADPSPIVRRIDGMEKRTIDSQSLSTLEERFQWPLALAVVALLVHLGVGPFRALTPPAPLSRPLPSSLPGRGGRKTKEAVLPPLPVGAGRRGRERGPGGEGPGRKPRQSAAAHSHLFPVVLLLGWAALPSLPSFLQPHLPVWAERWLYNPRERVEKAMEGDPKAAVRPADTALRLAPDDPLVQYDAGTAHLGAGHGRKAAGILEKAAKGAGPELSQAAHYNLGNARLAMGDASGAVQAYKQVLRGAPGNQNAKYNLEIALREEQKQKMGGQGSPRGGRGRNSKNQDPSNQQGKGKPDENPNQGKDPRQPPSPQQQGDPQRQGGDRDQQDGNQGQDDRLPQFRNQPEMSGREAASVLSAVENLERQQRRDQAARRARQRAVRGKDW